MPVRGVIVADQTHARLYICDDNHRLEATRPKFEEVDEVLNPMEPHLAKEAWTNIQSGRNHGASSQAHGYDDHRQNHLDEFERRYCSEIAQRGKLLIEHYDLRSIILVSPPRLLGFIRKVSYPVWPGSLKIHEVAKDLAKASTSNIYQYLVNHELLPSVIQRV